MSFPLLLLSISTRKAYSLQFVLWFRRCRLGAANTTEHTTDSIAALPLNDFSHSLRNVQNYNMHRNTCFDPVDGFNCLLGKCCVMFLIDRMWWCFQAWKYASPTQASPRTHLNLSWPCSLTDLHRWHPGSSLWGLCLHVNGIGRLPCFVSKVSVIEVQEGLSVKVYLRITHVTRVIGQLDSMHL